MAVSLEHFVNQLEESGLVGGDELRDLLPPHANPTDAEGLARELVRRNKLTRYQAEQFSEGKGKSLVLGNYVILDKLGQGGMGMVLKARHQRMDRIVALKVMSPAAMKSPDAVQRFHREVKAAAKLEHPNIVTAYDADEALGTHFLVMQFVEGTDLSVLVKKKGPLSVEQAIHCVSQAARGLEFAHQHGVIHRDIKPANLLLDKNGVVKILDMGLARIEGEVGAQAELTSTGAVMGTVDYMAPEQALSTKYADARSDMYSLGITLWYLLTGKSAYDGDTLMARLLAHRDASIPSLCAVRPEVPADIDAVFQKMVAKQAKDRYQSMTELLRDLGQLHEGAPSAAAPLTVPLTIGDSQLSGFGSGRTSDQGLPASAMRPQLPTATYEFPSETATEATILSGDLEQSTITQTLASGQSVVASAPPATEQLAGTVSLWRDRRIQLGLVVALLIAIAIPFLLSRGKERADQSQITSPQSSDEITASDSQAKNSSTVQGWHGWPADAPKPAIAPFGADQARQHQEEWAKYLEVPVEYTNSIGMKFVLIPPGEFLMGSTPEEIESAMVGVRAVYPEHNEWHDIVASEKPRHKVVLTQPIYMGQYEVTQGEYQTVMGHNPAKPDPRIAEGMKGLDTTRYPVDQVSWLDGAEFCAKLSERENLKPTYFRNEYMARPLEGAGYRLPTEALWEFACRAGTITKFWSGDSEEELERSDWFFNNFTNRTHAVGELRANPFGLYDMHGNVHEWIADRWHPQSYAKFAQTAAIDPTGPTKEESLIGDWRILRGASMMQPSTWCRSAMRGTTTVGVTGTIGLRLTLPVDVVRQKLSTIANDAPRNLIPIKSPEPPLLEEWLKGRTVLTVAQDGSGKFTTIQAALDALQPGQVVKVLDKGPYRERLEVQSPPRDTGLISEVQTIVELSAWKREGESGLLGHVFVFTDGFRVNGFGFGIAPELHKPAYGHGITFGEANGFVFENCAMRWPSHPGAVVAVTWLADGASQPCWIRECLFECGMISTVENSKCRCSVLRNYFIGVGEGVDLGISIGICDQFVIRENIFSSVPKGHDILLNFPRAHTHINQLQITNNTSFAGAMATVSNYAPTGNVLIANHLRSRPGLLEIRPIQGELRGDAAMELPRAMRDWQQSRKVRNNAYPRPLLPGEFPHNRHENLFPPTETDVIAPVVFLSTDQADSNFARIALDALQSRAGLGGDWPSYIGALPPGPAPEGGDWFTQLRERWGKILTP